MTFEFQIVGIPPVLSTIQVVLKFHKKIEAQDVDGVVDILLAHPSKVTFFPYQKQD